MHSPRPAREQLRITVVAVTLAVVADSATSDGKVRGCECNCAKNSNSTTSLLYVHVQGLYDCTVITKLL